MKAILFCVAIMALPFISMAQGLKYKPAPAPIKPQQHPSPASIYLNAPDADSRLSRMGMSMPMKKPTDQQVDSVYQHVYKTDVPVFYEDTKTPYSRRNR